MKHVFITGASGFIAKHILRELFEKGYTVRASVRSEKRKAELQQLFPDENLEIAFLDLNKDEGWSEAMHGCDVLMHTASPFPMGEPRNRDELIRPAVDGTLRALRAAKAAGITRVVLTSSSAAIYKDASKPKDAPSDEQNWTTPDSPSVSAYEASKTLAERAAWDFVSKNPEIELTTINPGAVFGSPMDQRFGTSLELVEQLMTGKLPMAPPLDLVTVDVRDVAMMHVAAIELDAAKGQRFAAVCDTLPVMELARMLHEWDSTLKTPKKTAPFWLLRIMALFRSELKLVLASRGYNLAVSGAKAERTFGFTYIPVKEALLASAKAIKESNS